MLKKFFSISVILAIVFSILILPGTLEAQELPIVPEGEAYRISANEVAPFKKGDIISLTLKITDIRITGGLLGLDLDVTYNPTYVVPVKKLNGRPDVTSAASSIMAKYENSKWTATTRLDNGGTDRPTLVLKLFSDADPNAEEPQREVAIQNDGDLWFTIRFQAVKDSDAAGSIIAYTDAASGTDNNTNSVIGQGIIISSKAMATPTPTKVPTPPPTEKPTPEPTQAPTAVALKIKAKPAKLIYEPGEAFSEEGISLAVTMSDGTTKTVSAAECTFMGFDSSKEGVQKVCVSYGKVQNYFSVRIQAPYIQALKIYQKPTKLFYDYGEAIDLTGLKISAVYSTGQIEELSNEAIGVYGYDCSNIGRQAVILMYQGVKTTYTVAVQNSVVGITLVAKPSQIIYGLGEDFNYGGLIVNAKYADGTVAPISNTKLVFTGYDKETTGVQRITVSYGKFTTSFSVRVNGVASLKGITLTKPVKLRYVKGEALDVTGICVTGLYTDGSTKAVDLSQVAITGFDCNQIGLQQLTVSYMNFRKTFSVAVYE